MRRILLTIPTLLIVLWIVTPSMLQFANPLFYDMVVIRASTIEALLWLFVAILVTGALLVLVGWYSVPAYYPLRRYVLIGLFTFAVLMLCWMFTPYHLLGGDNLHYPVLHIRITSPLVFAWFTASLIGSVLALLLSGQSLHSLHDQRQRQRTLLALLSDQLSEGVALYNDNLALQWVNTPGRQYLLPGGKLHPDIARLLQRTVESGRVASLSFTVSEKLRVNVQASPLDRHHLTTLIARPLQNEVDSTLFYEQFIRRIVHDMRNPLAAIIAHASNLQNVPTQDAAALLNTATTIENEAQRLTRLVDSMLFDARLAYVPLELAPLDLLDIIEEVYFQYDERAIREGKTIELETPAPPAPIEADRDLLVRALGNLVDNSLKYSKPGALIRIMLEMTAYEYTLKVTDTGDGIPPDYLPDRIFEALVRVRPRDSSSGSGLGLSIVKKIVELHHGNIRAESIVGRGTTMILCFPRKS